VFPALPSVVARALSKEFFLKKIKNFLCRRPLPWALGIVFLKKEKQPLPTAVPGTLGTKIFLKK
jgi:hypothetical protein